MHRQHDIDEENNPMSIITTMRRAAITAAALLAAVLLIAGGMLTHAGPAQARDRTGHVCIPEDDWCYDLGGGGGFRMGSGGSGAGGGSGGGSTPDGGSGGSSTPDGGSGGSSNGGTFDTVYYEACMERRDAICAAAGVGVGIFQGPIAGYGVQQVCRVAYKLACEEGAKP